jgi:hypothetical protein
MHGAAVGAARQLAGGNMCRVDSWDSRQHVGATPGVQTAQVQRMTYVLTGYPRSCICGLTCGT